MTQSRLKQVLDYNQDTGQFRWRRTGKVAGCKSGHGYWKIRVDKRLYNAHRLAWLYVYGEWPKDEIDHIDRNGENNAIANLRQVTSSQNKLNRRKHKGKLPWRGVMWRTDMSKWIAQASKGGKSIHIGTFDCPAAAALAYQVKTDQLHDRRSCGNV